MCILIKVLFQHIHIMSQTSQTKRQPEPLETPEDILVKDGEQCVCKCSHKKEVRT